MLSYKDHLPLTEIVIGDTNRTGSAAVYRVGSLHCNGDSKFSSVHIIIPKARMPILILVFVHTDYANKKVLYFCNSRGKSGKLSVITYSVTIFFNCTFLYLQGSCGIQPLSILGRRPSTSLSSRLSSVRTSPCISRQQLPLVFSWRTWGPLTSSP